MESFRRLRAWRFSVLGSYKNLCKARHARKFFEICHAGNHPEQDLERSQPIV